MARIFVLCEAGAEWLDIPSRLLTFLTAHQSSSRSFPAPLPPTSRCCCSGGVSHRGKAMGSDGKSDAICWRVTSPANLSRLLEREEEDSLRQWVRQLLLTRKGNLFISMLEHNK